MAIQILQTREPGSRYIREDGNRGAVRDLVRGQIIAELGTDANLGGDSAYHIVNKLPEQFLEDPRFGAALAIALYEAVGSLDALDTVQRPRGFNIGEFVRQAEQGAVKKAVKIFGDNSPDYVSRLQAALRACDKQEP